MNKLTYLVNIANKLDRDGHTKEADELDQIILKMSQAWPHDDEDEELSDELNAWLKADKETEGEENNPMFGAGGPSEDEIMAMEQGVDIFEGEDMMLLQKQLKTLTKEMELFTEALGSGQITGDDYETFQHIKEEFLEITKRIEEANTESEDLGFMN